jgi:peroxiredoxin Q/BCP
MSVLINQTVPEFRAMATSGKDVVLSALKGYKVVMYFYPKDNTPGCTQEGQDFTALYNQFKAAKTCVFGVSRDSLTCHERFKSEFQFPFELLTDTDESLCKLFDVVKQKNMYGKQLMGVERSTFLIDQHGVLKQEWRGVKVPGHAAEVLAAAQALSA